MEGEKNHPPPLPYIENSVYLQRQTNNKGLRTTRDQVQWNMETKRELSENMAKYGVSCVKIGNCGKVILENGVLSYDHKESFRYYTDERYAYEAALAKVKRDAERLSKWKESASKVFSTGIAFAPWSGKRKPEASDWVWKSDIVDSGVATSAGSEGIVFSGNVNQLRKFKSYAVNHARYLEGTYVFTNEEVENLLSLFYDYGLFEAYDSFSEYYHNGIVD